MKIILIFVLLTVSFRKVQSDSLSALCFVPKDDENISKVCKNESDNLSCEHGEVIMIKKIRYKKKEGSGINKCNDCNMDGRLQDWEIHPTLLENRLYQTCSSKINCTFGEDVERPSDNHDYVWYAHVKYECISTGLFRRMCSSWERTLEDESLHISLGQVSSLPQTCSCIIQGEHVGIIVADYRPYVNELECPDTSVFINGNEQFICSDITGVDASVYNTEIQVTNNRTNVTLSIRQNLPQMFWLYIEGEPSVIVNCTAEVNVPTEQSSTLTDTSTTLSAQVTTATWTASESVTGQQDTSIVVKTTPFLSAHTEEDSHIPISAIVGGVMGLVSLVILVVVGTYLVYKRRVNKKSRTKCNEDEYNTVRFEKTKAKKSKVMNDLSNESYVIANNRNDNLSSSSSEQNIVESAVYSQPAVVDDNYADINETSVRVQSLQNFRTENSAGGYMEPYSKTSISKERDSSHNYAKSVKHNSNKSVYNTLSGLDAYSHIDGLTENKVPQYLDNYSHITIEQKDKYSTPPGMPNDFYNQLTLDTGSHKSNDQGDYTRNDTEEYDHLGHMFTD